MFKVDRPKKEPASLKTMGYNSYDVVMALWEMCHKKCYLCETKNPDTPEIEHKEPHENKNKLLKLDWTNLFFSCRRCNSIKGNKHKGIIDPALVDPITKLIWNVPVSNYSDVTFEKVDKDDKDETVAQTILLLERCFNDAGTSYRAITRAELVHKINIKLHHYLSQTLVLYDEDSDEEDINKARNKLKLMLQSNYPYSAFWRWRFLRDPVLMKGHSDLLHEYKTLSPYRE